MKPTNAEKAYTQIKKKIVTTEMPPGSVINEAQLMEEFALGRTPIREAIKQLQMENPVVLTKYQNAKHKAAMAGRMKNQ